MNKRKDIIFKQKLSGRTYASIAEEHGISRANVRSIFKKELFDRGVFFERENKLLAEENEFLKKENERLKELNGYKETHNH
tara:strand:- start:44 stop:286 length:243 start_codon:yes stop_codon:yes gene_type:complete